MHAAMKNRTHNSHGTPNGWSSSRHKIPATNKARTVMAIWTGAGTGVGLRSPPA
jgi:hypothetical protein